MPCPDKIAQGDKPNKPVAKLIVDDKTYSLFASKKQILPEEDNASDINPQDTNHPLQIIVKDKCKDVGITDKSNFQPNIDKVDEKNAKKN